MENIKVLFVCMGNSSTYEQDVFLDMERGIVKNKRVRQNGTAEAEDAPVGYGIGGMTVFPRASKNDWDGL